jgi:protein required for attachment to host cells
MDILWIVAAHRGGAKIFESQHRQLSLVQELPHPEGRLQDKEIGTDRPGRSFDSHGKGRHAMSTPQRPTEHEAQEFARHLAQVLEEARVHNRYSKLVLVAEPRFLGELRSLLSPQTSALVSATRSRDLGWMETNEIQKQLQRIVWPSSPLSRPRH